MASKKKQEEVKQESAPQKQQNEASDKKTATKKKSEESTKDEKSETKKAGKSADKKEQQTEKTPREPQLVTVNGEKVTHAHAFPSISRRIRTGRRRKSAACWSGQSAWRKADGKRCCWSIP